MRTGDHQPGGLRVEPAQTGIAFQESSDILARLQRAKEENIALRKLAETAEGPQALGVDTGLEVFVNHWINYGYHVRGDMVVLHKITLGGFGDGDDPSSAPYAASGKCPLVHPPAGPEILGISNKRQVMHGHDRRAM
jgi:hypothetical protein